MAELRELARGVMQQGVGRLRRRARRLASLMGLDAEVVRTAARKTLEVAQALRGLARPGQARPFPPGHPSAGDEAGPGNAPRPQAPGTVGGALDAAGEPPVSAGFFQGPGGVGPRAHRRAGQLRLFARDARTLFALWEVTPSLRPPDAPHASLELRLRPVGGSVVERLEVSLRGRRYFEGLVPGRSYRVELWWIAEGLSPEPVAVAPRTATLPVDPARAVDPLDEAAPFVRVSWEEAPRTGDTPMRAATGGSSRARLTRADAPPALRELPHGPLRATARVGWTGSRDAAHASLPDSRRDRAAPVTSPASGWSGSLGAASWSGSPGGRSSRSSGTSPMLGRGEPGGDRTGSPSGPRPPRGVPSSPGGPGSWTHPPVTLPPPRSLAEVPFAQAPSRPGAAASSSRARSAPVMPHAPTPTGAARAPVPRPPPAAPARLSRKAKARAKAGARANAAVPSPEAAQGTPRTVVHADFFSPPTAGFEGREGQVISAGFFASTSAPPVRLRRGLASAGEGAPLSTAELRARSHRPR